MEETNARTFQMTVKTCEEKVKAYLQTHNEHDVSNVSITKAVGVKLPKISIEPFKRRVIKTENFY